MTGLCKDNKAQLTESTEASVAYFTVDQLPSLPSLAFLISSLCFSREILHVAIGLRVCFQGAQSKTVGIDTQSGPENQALKRDCMPVGQQ